MNLGKMMKQAQELQSKMAEMQERLAAQLRENLKKRKAFARARKTSEEDTD